MERSAACGPLCFLDDAEEAQDPKPPGMPKPEDNSIELELRVHQLPSRSHGYNRLWTSYLGVSDGAACSFNS